MTDSYRTLAGPCGPHELKEKASRFLALAAPAATAEEAEAFVTALKKRFHDAAHIGWACRLGEGEERAVRHSDGGEPAGTAGIPVHRELVRAELFNAVCAVVRYFGGVKLGTGGLSRAFAAVARALLEAAPTRVVPVTETLVLSVPFDLVGTVMRLAEQHGGATVVSQEYDAGGARLTVAVPRSRTAAFRDAAVERSGGRIVPV